MTAIWNRVPRKAEDFRKLKPGKPRIGKRDFVAAATSGIANVPDGMASGVLAGVNPVYGLYTILIGTPIAALSCSTALMVFNTTSAMTLVAADGLGGREGDDRVQALMAISIAAGIFQLVLGLLGLGVLTRFVSNAVMTGLLTGVAVLIVLGQLWDFFGYEGEGGNKLEQTANLLQNLSEIDGPSTAIGLLGLGLMFGLRFTRLSSMNLLIALAITTIVAAIWSADSIALVSSLGEIPRGLPGFDPPPIDKLFNLALSGVAVGVVGLLQAAGVAQRYSNADGSEPDDSRDFAGQGAANIACGMFQAMPGGGSLSGTALSVSAGATTRWATVLMAIFVMVLVLLFGSLLERIPMAALAALLIYSASLSIKFSVIQSVQRTTITSSLTMMATFLATLLIPLQQAIILGVIIAGVIYIYRSSVDIRVVEIQIRDGHLFEKDPPVALSDRQVLLLDVYGSLFYAGARTLSSLLPKPGDARKAVVILRLRGQGDVGSTLLTVLGKYSDQLRAQGGRLLLSGVDEAVMRRMRRTGLLDQLGEAYVFAATDERHASSGAALRAANQLTISDLDPGERDTPAEDR